MFDLNLTYCPPNVTLDIYWVNHGLTRCFLDTVCTSIITGFLVVFGTAESLVYRKYGTTIQPRSWRRSKLLIVQVFAALILTVLPIFECLIKFYLVHDGALYGYLLVYTVGNMVVWPLSLHLLHLERNALLPSIPARGHGLILLTFWTLSFVAQNLAFLNLKNEDWWFDLETSADATEFSLFVVRYVMTCMSFLLGLKAPGLYTTERLYRDGLVSGPRTLLIDAESGENGAGSPNRTVWSGFWSKMATLMPFLWPKKSCGLQLRVLICFVLLAAIRVANVFVPILYKMLVDSVTPSVGPVTFRWDLVLIFVAVKFLQGGFLSNLRTFLWIPIQQYTTRETEIEFFRHLHSLSLRWHLSRKTGEVLRVINRGTDSINTLLNYLLFTILPTIIDIVVAVVYFITAFNAWFGLIVSVTMILYMGGTVLVTEWRTKYKRSMNAEDNKLRARAVDSLLNFETVKYFGAERFELQQYKDIMVRYQVEEWKSTASLNLLNTVQNTFMTMGLLAGSMFCIYLVSQGQLTVGDYVLFGTYITQLYTPLNWLGSYYRMIQQSFIDMENMLDLLKEKQEVRDNPGALDLRLRHPLQGTIEFRNVSFGYRPDKSILKDVSFTVPAGKTVALVGPSGEGKSTIIRLLFRMFDVDEGAVLLDGQDVRGVTQASVRQAIGVVPQDTVLFNNTIKYNILYGRVDASDAEVEAAARAADIHDQICGFTDGYDTVVGERGLKLSGGEKQRVAIARTLLKSPAFVLLDEATSALDTNTERNIQASLARICADRTTLVVAHRLSTIVHADQILVLVDGTIAERGRHDELLECNGIYADMWNKQINSESCESDAAQSTA